MSRSNNSNSRGGGRKGNAGSGSAPGSGRRGPRREQKKNLDFDARSSRNGVSANHLLNFTLPEREKPTFARKKKTHVQPRTQSEFLHANFRFVISQLEDRTAVPLGDLEALTEWTSVEQVLLWYDDDSPMTCPICMDNFRAPKITKCGHIFCWPCILRYLSLSDKYWRRCPMCFESVQKGQLRSVRLEKVELPPRVGSEVEFQFLQRSKASMFPTLRQSATPALAHAASVTNANDCVPSIYDSAAAFSRILESTPEYVMQLVLAEMRDLEALDAEHRSSGEVDSLPFVVEAMRATSGRLAQLESSSHGDRDSDDDHVRVATGELYSFYQIANGSYVILHPINMKCLLKEYSPENRVEAAPPSNDQVAEAWSDTGGTAPESHPVLPVDRHHFMPDTVRGRVLDVEHVVMDDESQKRYRFLSHLPRFCDLYVCEIDLSAQLSAATLECFRAELKKREKHRRAEAKHRHAEAAARAASPLFASRMDGFSIEQEGMMWPAPAELSSEMHELSLDESGGSDEAHLSPVSPPLTTLATDDESSFATITRQSGYFPPLGGPAHHSPSLGAAPSSGSFGSPSAWGAHPSTSPPALDWDAAGRGGKKKAGGKKGVPLFSTTQRRSYR